MVSKTHDSAHMWRDSDHAARHRTDGTLGLRPDGFLGTIVEVSLELGGLRVGDYVIVERKHSQAQLTRSV